jgi:hypothetical protein
MEELVKFVSALPLPASIAFAAVSALVIWVARLGILEGRKLPPAHDAPAAQVAAVIVDPTALNAATSALNKHTAVIETQVAVQRDICVAIRGVGDQLEEIAKEMLIQREIGRRN